MNDGKIMGQMLISHLLTTPSGHVRNLPYISPFSVVVTGSIEHVRLICLCMIYTGNGVQSEENLQMRFTESSATLVSSDHHD